MKAAFGPGATFAGYRVESVVGRGGMGVVYRATDLSLERPVALKMIAPELAGDEHFRSRFLREPRLAASLDHPNVIPIYEAGEHEGQLYLAMRFVEGSDLGSVLEREGRLAPERALGVLAQVAGALDAAHRRALVHRDVKPANVLLDDHEHVYLTDFGISKQTGGASTDTGRMVGTLDYLAPEQIRGEDVDARTDSYALGCVLYECLVGRPPFRRDTEAETLWAHMQEQPAPVRGYPKLDQVLRKALAKDRDERYRTCGELIDAATAALGLTAPVRRRRTWPARLPRPRVLAGAGLVLVGASIIAVLALSAGSDADDAPTGNGVLAVGAQGGDTSLTEFRTAPSNVAVGAGAVWVLNTEDERISRIDPRTKEVTARYRTRGVPSDIAAGEGAVWVGNGRGYPRSLSRMDPDTGAITRTVRLSNRTAGSFMSEFNWGFANIAVGAGGVWARNPDNTVSRIDPGTGRLIERIDLDVDSLAAGEEGVWFLIKQTVVEFNPRTGRLGQRIRIGSPAPTALAVGAGSIWVTAEQEGVVWRIEPGPGSSARTIDVGVGVTYIAFGAGSLWTANYIDGTVTRIDPATNTVADRVPVGAAQALAAGPGSAWVSTAGATRDGSLPDSVCGALASGVADPDVLIASDLPLRQPGARAMADAIRFVLEENNYRAGRYSVGYRSCDDSTAQTGDFENRRCAANANAYAQADRLVALIGPYNSDCALVEIPILNRAPDGALAMISPTNTYSGLTRPGIDPPDGYRGEPDVYYPTGVRNYVRVRPNDDQAGAGHAVLARQLGLEGVYVLDDGSGFWRELLSEPFRVAARKLGVRVAGSGTFDPSAKSYAALAGRVARSGAEGVVVGGDPYNGADRMIKALRARLGQRVTIMGGFFLAFAPDVLKQAGPAARGMYATTLDLPLTALPMTAAGRRFARDVGAFEAPIQGVLEAGQSAKLVLRAIARSDGTRASVLEELRALEVRNDIMGTFRFDRNGDTTLADIPIVRITGATPPGAGLPPEFQGAVLDRVVQVPTRLVGGS